MKDFIQPILDFLFKLADKYGTKFLVALGGVGGLVYMAKEGILPGEWAGIGMVIIVVAYLIARRQQELGGGTQ